MSEVEQPQTRTRLHLGMLIVLVTMAIAGVVGLIAVVSADSDIGALGVGFGLAILLFQAGGTIACALACLARRRLEVPSLGALLAAGTSVDLFALAVLLDIDDETYGKLVAVTFVWTLFALVVIGLTLAAQPRDSLSNYLYLGAVGASVLGGLIATALIFSVGEGDIVATSPVPIGSFGNESLLRPLGAVLVVLAALWFAALAASRVERATER